MGAQIKRFNSRINQNQQNPMLVNNQRQFFQRLSNEEEENHQCKIPNSVEAKKFWRGIWSERKERDKDAEWLNDVRKEFELRENVYFNARCIGRTI